VVHIPRVFTISARIARVQGLAARRSGSQIANYTHAIKNTLLLINVDSHKPSSTTLWTEVALIRLCLAFRSTIGTPFILVFAIGLFIFAVGLSNSLSWAVSVGLIVCPGDITRRLFYLVECTLISRTAGGDIRHSSTSDDESLTASHP
jgi:hypothetical protein